MFCSISSHELSAKQQCFRIQQSTKTCPNMCSPIQKIHSAPMSLWISNIPYYWSTIELEKNLFSMFYI
ncbi:unnamed protein product [Rotaria sp. Silwood1]|nr:unnamed protein product [Rotaria sp. Silwood1]